MKKENFVTLIMSVVGGALFALGMCMCLVAEWDAFAPGVVMGSAGVIVLLAMVFIRRKMQGKPRIHFSGKTVKAVLLIAAGCLLLGLGLCMTMVWEGMLVWGIVVGLISIVLMICLIPFCKGLK